MKNITRYFFLGVFLLSGCESSTDKGNAGIEGTGDRVTLASAYGTVSGFGSIYVNGVHFDTDLAEVEIAGEAASEEDLAVGMVVEVVGQIDKDGKTGVAHSIRAERALRGIIESVDSAGDRRKALHILGQVAYVEEDATIVGTTFDELAPDLGVNVSGFVVDNGLITATYIARQDIDVATDVLEVEGYINESENPANTFQLNNLSVQIGGARFIGGGAQDLIAGRRVRVVGTLAEDKQHLQAAQVEFINRAIENRRTSLEGVVRNVIAGERFTLQSVQVEFGDARIENGALDDVTNGAQVVVFGSLTQGVLQAEQIRIKPRNPQRFRGAVSNINAAQQTFTLMQMSFQVTRFTQFRDESRTMERYFSLENLRDGEEVDIFAVNVADVWQVTRITRRDRMIGPPNALRGIATRISDDRSFYIANLFIDASGVPEHEWLGVRSREEDAFEVDVEGSYAEDGRFRATHIRMPPRPPCELVFECDELKPPLPRARSVW